RLAETALDQQRVGAHGVAGLVVGVRRLETLAADAGRAELSRCERGGPRRQPRLLELLLEAAKRARGLLLQCGPAIDDHHRRRADTSGERERGQARRRETRAPRGAAGCAKNNTGTLGVALHVRAPGSASASGR